MTPTRNTVDGAEQARGLLVTANYFPLLGGEAALGRTFLPEEEDEAHGAQPVMVLSHRFWEERLVLTSRLWEKRKAQWHALDGSGSCRGGLRRDGAARLLTFGCRC